MKTLILFLLVILLPAFGHAQEYEYGKPSELKGLTKIYVDTNGNVKDRDRIIEDLHKASIGIAIVDEIGEAEIFLQFGGTRVDRLAGGTTISKPAGTGVVAIRGKTPEKLRIIMNFESTQDKFFEKKPTAKFTKGFIEIYKQANELK